MQILKLLIIGLSACALSFCKPKQALVESDVEATATSGIFCPSGSAPSNNLCVTKTKDGYFAIGPFSDKMLALCKKATDNNETKCNNQRMSLVVAKSVRGNGKCQPGTSLHYDFCGGDGSDSKYVFGPFTKTQYQKCVSLYSEGSCVSMQWLKQKATAVAQYSASVSSNLAQKTIRHSAKGLATKKKIEKILGKTYCEKYWDSSNTTDYTIYDHFYNPIRTRPEAMRDRSIKGAFNFRKTMDDSEPTFLAGFNVGQEGYNKANDFDEESDFDKNNGKASNLVSRVCKNARATITCFEKSMIADEKSIGGKTLREFAKSANKNPMFIKMAIAAEETNLGFWVNEPRNGVGIMQLAGPMKLTSLSSGIENSIKESDDTTWAGITHNMLTNIQYGTHMLAVKVIERQPSSLNELADFYNASIHRKQYAMNVDNYYDILTTKCKW